MLDYRAMAALHAVIETQGFETAADKLFITQSAVSQRVKALENYYGEPLLIRTQPYRPTALGETLLGHYKRVLLLEETLQAGLSSASQPQRISIAISRDSLETWFVPIMTHLKSISPITLEIIADDQEITHEYLRKGLVSACASTSSKIITGCKAELLGYFDYVLVASPEFKKKYFANAKNIRQNLLKAPTMIFDNHDDLHKRYLAHFFNITDPITHYHVVPSVEGFRQFVLKGYAYALIPEIDIVDDLHAKKLVNLFPDKKWEMPLYWHTWAVETKAYQEFNTLVIKLARNTLRIKTK